MREEIIDPRLEAIVDCLYRVSAKAIIIHDNKLLMTQETKRWWSLPGGGIDHGESATEALTRELAEELSIPRQEVIVHEQVLQAIVGQIVDHIPRVALLYKVEIPAKAVQKTDHILDVGWFSSREVEKLYISPTVGGASELLHHIIS